MKTIKELMITEVSKKLLGSYIKKASDDASYHSFQAADLNDRRVNGVVQKGEAPKDALTHDKKSFKRLRGIAKATDKLIKEAIYTDQTSWEEDMKEHGASHFDRDEHRIVAKKSNGDILGAWSVSDKHGITGLGTNVQVEEVIVEKSQPKKFLNKFRGTTATGQKANVVDTNPTLNQKPLRQFRII